MSTQTREDFNSALKALEAANQNVGIPIWIPSLERTVQFGVITTGQQKNLIRALVDNPVYQTNYITAIYDIIKTNCRDVTVDIGSLPISDKVAIVIQLRQNSVGNDVIVHEETKEITVKLPDTKFPKAVDSLYTTSITAEEFNIDCRMPTIAREAQLEQENRSKIANSDIKSYDDVRNVLANAYIGELVKHIDTISFGTSKIYVGNLNFSDAYAVIEKIPSSVLRSVITYMESIQKYLVALKTFKGLDTTTMALKDIPSTTETVDTEITLDAAFFTSK